MLFCAQICEYLQYVLCFVILKNLGIYPFLKSLSDSRNKYFDAMAVYINLVSPLNI
jgi:hypothetical protein